MNSIQTIALIAIAVIIIAGIFYYAGPSAVGTPVPPTSLVTYANPNYGISFRYPSRYFVVEHDLDEPQGGHVVALFVDTPGNRDLVAGKIPNTEGPTSISIEIYPNPNKLSAKAFVESAPESNFKLGNHELGSAMVGKSAAVEYTWSGLYNGKTVVTTMGDFVYSFTATYDSASDITLTDFPAILKSVELQ